MERLPADGPVIVERLPQCYAGTGGLVTLQHVSDMADRIPVLLRWLGERGIAPAGPPFLKYNVIDMERQLEIEAGVPVAAPVTGGGEVRSGVLPGGRYLTVVHTGHPAGLAAATAGLLAWAGEHGLDWDMEAGPGGARWGCRLEEYLTNPAAEPDPARWQTRLAFRLA